MIVEYQNQLAVPANMLYGELGLMGYDDYKNGVRYKRIKKLRTGGGKNSVALVALNSLKPEWRAKIIAMYPKPEIVAETNTFSQFITEDTEAIAYFIQMRELQPRMTAHHVTRHSNEAAILNGLKKKWDGIMKHSSRGATTRSFWKRAVIVLDSLQQQWPHNLPKTEKRLQEKYSRYQEHGYASLLKGWSNQNSRVVNEEIEQLLNSIYCQYFKPNHVQVLNDYMAFLAGKKDIVNKQCLFDLLEDLISYFFSFSSNLTAGTGHFNGNLCFSNSDIYRSFNRYFTLKLVWQVSKKGLKHVIEGGTQFFPRFIRNITQIYYNFNWLLNWNLSMCYEILWIRRFRIGL